MSRDPRPHPAGPSPALVISMIALAVSLSGVAIAGTNSIDSGDVQNNSIRSADLRDDAGAAGVDVVDESLGAADLGPASAGVGELDPGAFVGSDIAPDPAMFGIRPGAVSGSEVGDSSLTGADVASATLTGADVSDSSLDDYDIVESTLEPSEMGCKTGLVKGYAALRDEAPGGTYTADAVDTVYNCSGGAVQARSAGGGEYYIRFLANPSNIALAASLIGGDSGNDDNVVALEKLGPNSPDPNSFHVSVHDQDGDTEFGYFYIVLF